MIRVKNDRVIITSDRGVVGIAADLTQKESGCFSKGLRLSANRQMKISVMGGKTGEEEDWNHTGSSRIFDDDGSSQYIQHRRNKYRAVYIADDRISRSNDSKLCIRRDIGWEE